MHAESSSCFPLHHRLMEIRTNVIPHKTDWRIAFLPFPDPVSSLSRLSRRQSSPPSFRPLLYVETILDKYRWQHVITTEQLHYNTVQHCFNICPPRSSTDIYTQTPNPHSEVCTNTDTGLQWNISPQTCKRRKADTNTRHAGLFHLYAMH